MVVMPKPPSTIVNWGAASTRQRLMSTVWFSLPSPGQIRRRGRNDPSKGGTGKGEKFYHENQMGSFRRPSTPLTFLKSSDSVLERTGSEALCIQLQHEKHQRPEAGGYRYHQSGMGLVLGHGKGLELDG